MIRAVLGFAPWFAIGIAAATVVLYATGAITLGDSLLILGALVVGLLVIVANCAVDVREHSAERRERQRL